MRILEAFFAFVGGEAARIIKHGRFDRPSYRVAAIMLANTISIWQLRCYVEWLAVHLSAILRAGLLAEVAGARVVGQVAEVVVVWRLVLLGAPFHYWFAYEGGCVVVLRDGHAFFIDNNFTLSIWWII